MRCDIVRRENDVGREEGKICNSEPCCRHDGPKIFGRERQNRKAEEKDGLMLYV